MSLHQELFDKVVAHSRAQPFRAITLSTCEYRRGDGAKCFVGALIPDELYTPAIEGSRVTGMQLDSISNELGWDTLTRYFLFNLQVIHDNTEPSRWETALAHFADIHGLSFPSRDLLVHTLEKELQNASDQCVLDRTVESVPAQMGISLPRRARDGVGASSRSGQVGTRTTREVKGQRASPRSALERV